MRILQNLQSRYNSLQYRLMRGWRPLTMAMDSLQILVSMHYLFEATFHYVGENVDVRDEATEVFRRLYRWEYAPEQLFPEHVLLQIQNAAPAVREQIAMARARLQQHRERQREERPPVAAAAPVADPVEAAPAAQVQPPADVRPRRIPRVREHDDDIIELVEQCVCPCH